MHLFKKKAREAPTLKSSETQNLNQPMTITRLAGLYGVSRPTMRKWIKPLLSQLGGMVGKLYNLRQVKVIMRHLGTPGLGSDLS